jgi:hypothetical protein
MKTWEEMTKRERRVAIAQDVLKHIEVSDIRDNRGFIVLNDHNYMFTEKEGVVTPEECEVLRKNCSMCARGAMMISRIDIFNSINWSDFSDQLIEEFNYVGAGLTNRRTTAEALKGAFGKKQLGKIESAFEKRSIHASEYCSDDVCNDCVAFGIEYSEPKDRLKAIMENIVENGKFKP